MRYLVLLILFWGSLFASPKVFAFEAPKSFRSSNDVSDQVRTWFDAKSLESVHLQRESLTLSEAGDSAFEEIKEMMAVKGKTLPKVLSVKNWKLTESSQTKAKNGSRILWFAGNYLNSSDELTSFVEVYEIGKTGSTTYLFTRPKKPWTKGEVASRFKVPVE